MCWKEPKTIRVHRANMRNPYPNFIWFVGVAEELNDPSQLGRVRVRAIGFHPSIELLATDQLPWAMVLNGGNAKILKGQMVLGFFMDGEEAQQPCVLGVIGGAVTSSPVFDYLRNVGDAVKEWLGSQDNPPEVPPSGPNSVVAPNPTGFMNPLGNASYKDWENFGRFRQYYNGGKGGYHQGVDLATNPNATVNIFAAKDGTVTIAGTQRGYGYVVYIDHGDGIQTRYGHMRYTPNVKKGQQVKQGDIIGIVGSTGRSTGDHLHYEVRVNGTAIDPAPYLAKKG